MGLYPWICYLVVALLTEGFFLLAQMVKNTPAVRETQVRSLGQEAPMEKEMATHSSVLAWEIPWTEEPGGLRFIGLQRVRYAEEHTHMHPLQNPPTFSVEFNDF